MKRLIIFTGVLGMILCLSILAGAQTKSEGPPATSSGPPITSESGPPPLMLQTQPQMLSSMRAPSLSGWGEEMLRKIDVRRLGMNADQVKQYRQIDRDFQLNTAKAKQELTFAEQDLSEAMLADPIDQEAIDAILEKMASAKQQINEEAIQQLMAFKKLLGPQQFKQLTALELQLPAEFARIQLAPDQLAQAQAIMKEATQERWILQGEFNELQTEFRSLIFTVSEEVDAEKFKQLQDNLNAKEAALKKIQTDTYLKLQELLTPEQKEQLQRGGGRGPGAPRTSPRSSGG